MTTSNEPCPDCGNQRTHAETMTDLTVITSNPTIITVYRCTDCGNVWQVVSDTKQVNRKES